MTYYCRPCDLVLADDVATDHFRWCSPIHALPYYTDKPASGTDITVAGTRWLWVPGRGWCSPTEAKAAA